MKNWTKTTVGALCARVCSGGTPKSSNPGFYAATEGIPWLNTKEIDFNRVRSTEKHITEAGFNASAAKWVDVNSVIVAMYGATAGKCCINKIPLTTNQACCNLTANPEVCDYRFLYFYLCDKYRELAALANGGAQQNLNAQIVKNFEIDLPPLETQRKIAEILSALDDKIELNRRINENLEEQAAAIFKAWFVDAPEARAWKKGTFADLIEKIVSGDWGKETPSGNNVEMVYCIRGTDIPEARVGNKGKMPTRYILPKNYAAKQLTDGDIVVEISGGSPTQSTGRAAVISSALLNRYDKGMVCTNFCKALKPAPGYSMFTYYYWRYLYANNVFFAYENGTTGIKNLDITGFIETEPIVVAPRGAVARFEALCRDYLATICANGLKNEKLAAVRDALLPRLTSGEIDVSNVAL